jgi:hypothetical protein
VSDQVDWLESKDAWSRLQSLCLIESERLQGDQRSVERRYYISSLSADAGMHASVVRSHWAIENTLHWTLDMTFREDHSRNFSITPGIFEQRSG